MSRLWLAEGVVAAVKVCWANSAQLVIEPATHKDFRTLLSHLETALNAIQLFNEIAQKPSIARVTIRVVEPARYANAFSIQPVMWRIVSGWDESYCSRAYAIPDGKPTLLLYPEQR